MIPCGSEPPNGIIQGIGGHQEGPVMPGEDYLKTGISGGLKKGGDIGKICDIWIGYKIVLIIKVKGVGNGIGIDNRGDRCN
jgi:hypothetical protein